MSLWDEIVDLFTVSDEERVDDALEAVEQGILSDTRAQDWMRNSGWNAIGDDVAGAFRRPATRDMAVFAMIDNFYQSGDDPARMLERFTRQGLNDGTATRTMILNSGEGSQGRSQSNHQAALVIDESTNPPTVTLAFRGMNPMQDWQSPINGLIAACGGRPAEDCQRQADLFWEGAGPEITRAIEEVAARHGGQMPRITVAGHSYGSDAAARMIPKLVERFPQARESVDLVGYGAILTFTREERDRIFSLLGNDNDRARQYMVRDDLIQHLGLGFIIGAPREIPMDVGHVHYEQSSNMAAMMEALREGLARDPARAAERARALVDEYRRDPNSLLAELAAYTTEPPSTRPSARSGEGQRLSA